MQNPSEKYIVDSLKMDEFIRVFNRQKLIPLALIIGTTMLFFGFYMHYIIPGNPGIVLFSILFTITLVFGIFRLQSLAYNKKLRLLGSKAFRIDNNGITQLYENATERHIAYKEIAVFVKAKAGTIIIKGDKFTRSRYYSKHNPYAVDNPDVIYIPFITSNYDELVTAISQYSQLIDGERN